MRLSCPRFTLLFAIVAATTGSTPLPAAEINFDDAPNGAVVNTRYPNVTFLNPLGGDIFARGSAFAPSSPNVVSVFASGVPAFDARFGAVDARLASPVAMVSIDARPVAPPEFAGQLIKRPFLQAFDSGGALLQTVYYQGALPTGGGEIGPVETLTITSASNNIASVRFTVQNPNQAPAAPPTYGLFDNLRFAALFSLAANAATGGSVTASPSQVRYAAGTVVTLTATPLAGWRFSHWSGDASGTANPLTLTMNAHMTVTANFVRVSPELETALCVDFNSGVPPGVTLFGDARVDVGYLKLHSVGQPATYGVAYIDDFNHGAPVAGFRAVFDAALFGSTCCLSGFLPADGFSFNLVPAATVLPNPGYAEPGEEGLDQGLAVNFDTWDNGGGEAPAIEVKWLGQVIARAPFQPSQSPAGVTDPAAAARPVVINLDPDGKIGVAYGGTIVLRDVATPYRASVIGTPKWVLGARVGLANDNHWIDNLCITSYAGPKECLDFNAGLPDGTRVFGAARAEDGVLKLASVTDPYGVAYVEDFGGGRPVEAFRATFRAALFGSTCCGGGAFPADGFSFNLVPAATLRPSPGYGEPAEEGLDEGLAINFDTWDNGFGEAPAIEVRWLGQLVASAPFQASQSPAGVTDPARAWRDVAITLRSDGTLDVIYGGAPVLNNVQTPYDPAAIGAPAWVLGARNGGANDNHWIDDLCIAQLPGSRVAIPGLFNTGVGDDRRPLGEDQVDPHYVRIPSGPSIDPTFPVYAATASGGFPVPPWIVDNRSSAWISGVPDTVMVGGVNHIFETRFNLNGLDPASARIAGRWAADNQGVQILINGDVITPAPLPDFTAWQHFQITGGFVSGENVLRFVVENGLDLTQPQGRNPAGVRVELWGSAAPDCAGSPVPPVLTIRRVDSAIVCRWQGIGFVLQGAVSVTGPWRDLTRGLSPNGEDFTARLDASGPARFFRLRHECE